MIPPDGLPVGSAADSLAALIDGSGALSWASPGFQRITGLGSGVAGAGLVALAAPSARRRLEVALAAAGGTGVETLRVGGRRADGIPFVVDLLVERAGRDHAGSPVVALTGGRFGGPVGRPGDLEPTTEHRPGIDAVLSHDVRGALRHANGFAGVVRRAIVAAVERDALPEDLGSVPERLDTALTAVGVADEMVVACVRYLRAIAEPVVVEPISIERLVARAVVSARERLDDVDPGVTVEGGGLAVSGSPERLTEALAELLVNAVRFGGPTVTARLSATSVEPGWVELVVHDDGPGMDPALAEDAFLPGRMLQPRGRFPGVGMGLAAVRLVATRHGGTVRVDADAPAPGTAVVLELPAAGPADDR